MKSFNKYKPLFIDWFYVWPRLFREVVLFFVYVHLYLYKFFSGLRLFSESYNGIISDLENRNKNVEQMKNRNNWNNTDIETYAKLIGDLKDSKKEQEKIFTGLFGILIAVLALFISVLALLIKK